MFDYEYRHQAIETVTASQGQEARHNRTVLLDDDLDNAVGGVAHIGEEIPQ